MCNKKYDFAVMGGDMRMVYTAEVLKEMGYHVCTCGLCGEYKETERLLNAQSLESVAKASDAVILPIPVTKKQKYCLWTFWMKCMRIRYFLQGVSRQK